MNKTTLSNFSNFMKVLDYKLKHITHQPFWSNRSIWENYVHKKTQFEYTRPILHMYLRAVRQGLGPSPYVTIWKFGFTWGPIELIQGRLLTEQKSNKQPSCAPCTLLIILKHGTITHGRYTLGVWLWSSPTHVLYFHPPNRELQAKREMNNYSPCYSWCQFPLIVLQHIRV